VDSLSVRPIKNSVVYPTIRVASPPGKLLMGVYDDDNYVDGTALNRRLGEQGAPVPRDLFPVAADSDAPEAIYAGTLYFHFGHFLLESLARAWYAHRYPDVPFVWRGTYLAGVRVGAVAVGDPRHPHDQEPHEDHRGPRPIQPSARPGHRLPLRRQVPPRARRVPGPLRRPGPGSWPPALVVAQQDP
jgi:hypothetical protein